MDWLTTVDHKKLGILYLWFTLFFFAVGGIFALLVRTQLAVGENTFLANDAYNQIFTMHASSMLFLFIIPIWAGFGNYFVPLHIGAMDMAFPRINALSFWMLPPAAILMFAGFLVDGGAAAGGWTAYTPLSRQAVFSNVLEFWLSRQERATCIESRELEMTSSCSLWPTISCRLIPPPDSSE